MLTHVISQSFPAALSFACTTVEPCMDTVTMSSQLSDHWDSRQFCRKQGFTSIKQRVNTGGYSSRGTPG